ncbi:MAG: carboxy terminal-processing peptidase [Porticoccaceae bacterium]
MKRLSAALTFIVISIHTWAAVEALVPSASESRIMVDVLDKLGTDHYRKMRLDDQLSSELLDNYLDSLDSTKSFFTAVDIAEFKRWQYDLDDSLKAGDLTAGFTIFNRFRLRFTTRMQATIDLLKSDYEFDFAKNETLSIDPKARSWMATTEEADDYWRKRIKDSMLQLILANKEPKAARELLIKRYQSQIDQINQQDQEDVFQAYVNALTGLYDPHTDYLSARSLDNFNISMSLSLEGIGAVLQKEDEYTQVVSVVAGGPANKQGTLGPGDKIIGVGQGTEGPIEDVVGWRLDDVVALVRGKKGTTVRLQVIPDKAETPDKTVHIEIVRDKVKLEEQAAKSKIIEVPSGTTKIKLGVIEVPAFYMDFEAYRNRDPDFKSTTRDVQKLLEELRQANVQGIVLDLRNNGGGSLYEAVGLTDLFIDPGPVVQIRHSDQKITKEIARRQAFYRGPLVVLINRLSASASEIFAGAIQDYRRGLLVGTQSFGKGTVQVMAPLAEGQLKLTESKFYRVSGDSTQNRGVIPDLAFPSIYSSEEIGESQEKHALPWDSIKGLRHPVYGDFSPLIEHLKTAHLQRAANDPDWRFMLDEIDLVNKKRELKVLPLNKKEREALQQDQEQALFNIENQRLKAKQLPAWESIQAWRDDETKKQDERKANPQASPPPDPQLQEAGYVLADYIGLLARMPQVANQ